MKIETVYREDEDWREYYTITVDGVERIDIFPPEPEDATLTRDLSFAYLIVPLMREAYEAGKRGDEFEVTTQEAKGS